MAIYRHREFSPSEERELKNLAYKSDQTSAMVDYIAAMADIEIPEEEEAEDGEDEV